MPLTPTQILEITQAGEAFLEKRRPPEEVRANLDLGYRIDGQSVFVFGLRPNWGNPTETMESPVAKTTYVAAKKHWRVFWLRSNLKWYPYDPEPTVETIGDFFDVVNHDNHACFFG
ncbi:MAG: DUF3024 domain-containing protein [Flavobacteriales bacterium]